MDNRLVLVAILLIAGAMILVSVFMLFRPDTVSKPDMSPSNYRGVVYDPPLELTDFTLPASTGTDLSLRDLRGQWVLMFFGYTHCPDFCSMTLIKFSQAMETLQEEATQLQVVFISVDGERDTPNVLGNYVSRFHPTFIGLSGDDATLARIQPEFGLYYHRNEGIARDNSFYLIDHSTHSYLIDPHGRLRVAFAYDTDQITLSESIREMMRQN